MKDKIEACKNLIANGKIDDAISNLLTLLKGTSHENAILLISQKFRTVQRQVISGLIKDESALFERNKTTNQILNLLTELNNDKNTQKRKQLNQSKSSILEKFENSDKELKRAILMLLKKMTVKDSVTINNMYQEIYNLSPSHILFICNEIKNRITKLNKLRKETEMINNYLNSSDIVVKLMASIPFCPFISIEEDIDLNSPLYQLWFKSKNITYD